jgi:hypothetical protein
MESNDFKAEEVVSIFDAGWDLHILNASSRDLFDI